MKDYTKNTTSVVDWVKDTIKDRQKWVKNDEIIIKKRMSDRPKNKKYPYRGAPNFVEPIIDDNVNEKTDQEMSMLFNVPHLCHAVPLVMGVDNKKRAAIEQAFDSYVRHIVRLRPIMEQAMDCKNSRGFSIIKNIREYNSILRQKVPSIEVPDNRDIVVPVDLKSRDFPESPFVCHIHRYSKSEFLDEAKTRGWNNVNEVMKVALTTYRNGSGQNDDGDEFDVVGENIYGVTTSRGYDGIVVYELYHYATEDDLNEEVKKGDRVLTWVCPDCPSLVLDSYPWREADTVTIEPILNVMGRQIGQAPKIVQGAERPWPYTQLRAETLNDFFYSSRGAGHKLMDDQIYATSLKNSKAVMLDYFGKPMLESTGDKPTNSSNITFEPGSVIPNGYKLSQPRELPQSLSFELNQTRALAARRVGSAGQYNYSIDQSASRKLEKTATEIMGEQQRTNMVSSSSVDRVNSPMSNVFQLLWDDLRRVKIQFPVVSTSAPTALIDPSLYDVPVMMIPAASSKTLNPEYLLQKSMGLVNWLVGIAGDKLPLNMEDMVNTVLSNYDSNLTAGWVASGATRTSIDGRMDQLMQMMQQLAQAGQAADARMTNIEKALSVILKGNPNA